MTEIKCFKLYIYFNFSSLDLSYHKKKIKKKNLILYFEILSELTNFIEQIKKKINNN
jgi:hypothetical protein